NFWGSSFVAGPQGELLFRANDTEEQRAIVDANLTTLITSVVLYAYGTGPVKGFAVTMAIGIVASMITAILGTHGMFDTVMNKIEKSGNTRFWFGYKRV
ncbi:MAG: hypothetical protein ACFNUU_06200, partial [Campylobacter sp.]